MKKKKDYMEIIERVVLNLCMNNNNWDENREKRWKRRGSGCNSYRGMKTWLRAYLLTDLFEFTGLTKTANKSFTDFSLLTVTLQ